MDGWRWAPSDPAEDVPAAWLEAEPPDAPDAGMGYGEFCWRTMMAEAPLDRDAIDRRQVSETELAMLAAGLPIG